MNATARAIQYPSLAAIKVVHRALLQRFLEERLAPTAGLYDTIERFLLAGEEAGLLVPFDTDRRAIQSILDYWTTVLYRANRNPPDAILAEYEPSLSPSMADADCPYLGLDAFDESDAQLFFGRTGMLADLVDRVRANRMLAVVGPSGSGKSSLVRAGLVPALKRGAVEGSESWCYFGPVIPGPRPLEALAAAFAPPGTAHDIAAWIARQTQAFRTDPGALANLAERSCSQPVVLVVDQFEEVYTWPAVSGESTITDTQVFLDNLLGLVTAPGPRHSLILSLRSDFESYVARSPRLLPLFNRARVGVPPLTAAELRETIERPAELVGLQFEEGVVDDLLRGIVGEPAALPLLQFTLLQLWQKRTGSLITWEAYREVTSDPYQRESGARWALAHSADLLYHQLLPEDQSALHWILLQLVQPGDGLEFTSKRVLRRDLLHGGPAADRVVRVLTKLIRAHLIRRTSGATADDEQVELAHEALVRNWPRLSDWLDDERTKTRQRRRLRSAVDTWKIHNRDAGGLWGGALIAEAYTYPDLTPNELAFLQASARAEADRTKTRRRVKYLSWVLVVILGSVAVLLVGAVMSIHRRDISRGLAANAELLSNNRVDLALLLAVQAYRTAPTPEAEAALQETLSQTARLAALLRSEGEAAPVTAQFDAEGGVIGALADGAVDHWNSQGRQLPWTAHLPATQMKEAALSHDATRLAFIDEQGQLRLWNTSMDQQIGPPLTTSSSDSTHLAFGGDAWLAAGGTDSISIWRISTDGAAVEIGSPWPTSGQVLLLAMSADGSRLAWSVCGGSLGDSGGTAVVHLLEGQPDADVVQLTSDGCQIASLALSADGSKLVSGSTNGAIQFWDLSSSMTRGMLMQQQGAITALALSSDGAWIASGDSGGETVVWDGTNAQQATAPLIARVPKAYAVTSLAFSDDHKWLLSGYDRGTPIAVWDVGALRSSDALEQNGTARATTGGVPVAAGGCGRWTSTNVCVQGQVTFFDASGRTIGAPLTHSAEVTHVAISPDQLTAASVSSDGEIVIWDAQTATPRNPPLHLPDHLSLTQLRFDSADILIVETPTTNVEFDVRSLIRGPEDAQIHACALADRPLTEQERDQFQLGDDVAPCAGVPPPSPHQ